MIEEDLISYQTCSICDTVGKSECSLHFDLSLPKDRVNILLSKQEFDKHGQMKTKYYLSDEISDALKSDHTKELFETPRTEDHPYAPFSESVRIDKNCSEKQRLRYFGNTCEKMNENLIEFFKKIPTKSCPIRKFLKDIIQKRNTTVVGNGKFLQKVLETLCELDIPPKSVVAKSENCVSYVVMPYSSLNFVSIESYIQESLKENCSYFPHNLNTKKFFGYRGKVMPQYYISIMDNQSTIRSKTEYVERNFNDHDWDFFLEAKKHLEDEMNDLLVKSELLHSVSYQIQDMIIKYFDPKWKFISVFSNMSWSQFGFNLCGNLCLSKNDVRVCRKFFQNPYVANCSDFEYLYTMYKAHKHKDEDLNGGFLTANIQYFGRYPADLYSKKRKKITELLECRSHLHFPCRSHKSLNTKKSFGLSYEQRKKRRKDRRDFIMKNFEKSEKTPVKKYKEVWQCEWYHKILSKKKVSQFFKNFHGLKSYKTKNGKLKKSLKRLRMADGIKPAINDVFQMYYSKERFRDYECLYLDYFSHYGSIMLQNFPCGNFERISQDKIANRVEFDEKTQTIIDKSTNAKAIGLIHCTVKSPRNKIDASMPYLNQKLCQPGEREYSVQVLCKDCYESKNTEICEHNQEHEVTLHLSELHHMLQTRKYSLKSMHELILYKKEMPIFKRLMEILIYLKLCHTKKDSAFENYEENVNNYVEEELSLPKIFPNHFEPCKVKKDLIKKLLVSISGSLLSNPRRTKFYCCNDYEKFMDYHNNGQLKNFFEINEHTLGLICKNDTSEVDLRRNGFLYSEIISRGRQKLDRLLKTVQMTDYAKVLYADNDSCVVMVKREKKDELLKEMDFGIKAGQMRFELKGEILEFCALKNKTYSILYRNAQNQVRQLLKMSGFQIENEVRHDSFISMLETFKNNEPQEMNISQVRNSKRQNCTFTNQGVEKKRIVNFEDDGLPTDPYGRTWI